MAGEKYTNIGKARWENANVGVIKWDPENKAGLASVIDETTGTVYEIGGGGGGESDFSTATVTLKSNGSGYYSLYLPCLVNFGSMPLCTVANPPIYPDAPQTFEVPMYNGLAGIPVYSIKDTDTSADPILEGSCELKTAGPISWYEITGDCTITLAGTGTN